MFTTVLLILAKRWKQHKCTSTDEWIDQVRSTEYSSAIRRNEVLIHVTHMDEPWKHSSKSGVPNSWATDQYHPWPLRNWKEVSRGQASETSSVLTHITTWALPPVRSSEVLDSQRSVNPTVNWACEGSNLQDPYENLMPDDLILQPWWAAWLFHYISQCNNNKVYNKCNVLEPFQNHPPTTTHLICAKVVFHETSPWCQEGWGPLFYVKNVRHETHIL